MARCIEQRTGHQAQQIQHLKSRRLEALSGWLGASCSRRSSLKLDHLLINLFAVVIQLSCMVTEKVLHDEKQQRMRRQYIFQVGL